MRCLPLMNILLIGCLACPKAAQAGLTVIKKGDNYNIQAETKLAKNKKSAKLTLVIEPTAGWKIDKHKGPAGFALEPSTNIRLTKKAFAKTDAKWEDNKRIRFEVPFQIAKPGENSLEIKFRFVLCTDKLCQMKRFSLTYPIKS